MKIRNGFVSNSSSSSFVIIGKKLEKTQDNCKYICDKFLIINEKEINEFKEMVCCNNEIKNNFCPTCGKHIDDIEGTINYMALLNEYQYDISDIDIHSTEDDTIIGISIDLNLEHDSIDIDKFITKMKNAKKEVEKIGIDGKIKLHCGTSYS